SVAALTPPWANRRANLGRVRTSCNSASSTGVVNSVIRPARAASRIWRGGPCHKRPDTTTLVSGATRMSGPPFSARGLDLSLDLCCGQRSFGERRQPVAGVEQLADPAALDLL